MQNEEPHISLLPFDLRLYVLEFYANSMLSRIAIANYHRATRVVRKRPKTSTHMSKHKHTLFGYFVTDPLREIHLVFRSIEIILPKHVSTNDYLLAHVILPSHNVKNLVLRTNDINKSQLLHFIHSNRSSLQTLDLTGDVNLIHVDLNQLLLLGDCQKLVKLTLDGTRLDLTQAWASLFSNLTQLKHLSLRMVLEGRVTDSTVTVFKDLINLESLSLTFSGLSESGVLQLVEQHPKLRSLAIEQCKFTEQSRFNPREVDTRFHKLFESLGQHKNLSNLVIRNNKLPTNQDDLLQPLIRSKSLKSVDLSDLKLSGTCIRKVIDQSSVTKLDISRTTNLSPLLNMRPHTITSLKADYIDSKASEMLQVLPISAILTHLSIDGTNANDDTLEQIFARSPNLTSLSAAECSVTDLTIRSLFRANLRDLQTLDLHGNNITVEGALFLSQIDEHHLPSLKELNLSSTFIGSEGAKYLFMNKQYTALILCNLNLDDNCLEPFRVNTTLTSINLTMNQMTSAGAEILFTENNTLTSINLSANRLDDKCLVKLAHAPTAGQRNYLHYLNILENDLITESSRRVLSAFCDWIEHYVN